MSATPRQLTLWWPSDSGSHPVDVGDMDGQRSSLRSATYLSTVLKCVEKWTRSCNHSAARSSALRRYSPSNDSREWANRPAGSACGDSCDRGGTDLIEVIPVVSCSLSHGVG